MEVRQQGKECPACKHRIVEAVTAEGIRIAIDTGLRAYTLMGQKDGTFLAEHSRAYPVHACRGEKDR